MCMCLAICALCLLFLFYFMVNEDEYVSAVFAVGRCLSARLFVCHVRVLYLNG